MNRMLATSLVLAMIAFSGGVVSCSTTGTGHGGATQPVARKPIALPTVADTTPHDYPGIHNAVAFHEGFVSGSVPEGEAGFETLAAMGIKTIISVDGAAPEVEKAKALGIRYIHLPIGYNGFDEQRKLQLVRATRDSMAQGPVYIHCHHGKHRSAGAAAAVATSLGWSAPDAAIERMKVSGTAPGYKGLYACAASASVIAATTIDAVPANFPAVSRPTGFVKSMVEIDEVMDLIKIVEKAGWKAPSDHPDLVAVAEAGRLADLLRHSGQSQRAKREGPEFGAMITENEARAQKLEDLLAGGSTDATILSAQFKLVSASCKDCHVKFRD
ncbi:MAG: hypothetical protein NTV94_06360 [Planctomycetota bacterium]|nr:hypothetical protein [Planctomycetota bacterium]